MNVELVRFGFVMPHWVFWSLLIVFPVTFLLVSKWLDRRRAAQEEAQAGEEAGWLDRRRSDLGDGGGGETTGAIDWSPPGNRFTRVVDDVCLKVGLSVCLWTVICVFYYVFEVVARYFFRAPTNWVHEASFLTFGMMYTLGGAALYLLNGHVRVDLFYTRWSRRGRAAMDMITFPFFSIFILGILLSGWIFFGNALDRNVLPDWIARGYRFDISATEWQIAYWLPKGMIPLAALLVFLQGISRFVKDFQTYMHFSEVPDEQSKGE